MTVEAIPGGVKITGRGKSVTVLKSETSALLTRHATKYPDKDLVERAAARVIESKYDPAVVEDYVRKLFAWGKGRRLLDRVLENGIEELARRLREEPSLVSLNELKFLKTSFSSKMLSFLDCKTVIMDSWIDRGTGYKRSTDHGLFQQDCERAGEILGLCTTQVETVIFMKIQEGAGLQPRG